MSSFASTNSNSSFSAGGDSSAGGGSSANPSTSFIKTTSSSPKLPEGVKLHDLIEPIILENNVITKRDGNLDIFANFDQFMSQWKRYLSDNGIQTTTENPSYTNILTNTGKFLGPLFGYYKNLMLINSDGNGHCFNNSLFIFTSMAKIYDSKFLNLFATAELDDYNITIGNFISSQLVLADKYIDSKNLSQIRKENEKSEIRDPNTPEIYPFLYNFSNLFNCNVLIVSVHVDTFEILSKTYENPTNQANRASEPDHVVLIQKGRSHFQVLVLHNSTREQRKKLYDDIFNFTRDLLGY
jgi:hypothetical protein